MSKRWGKEVLNGFLCMKGQEKLKVMKANGEKALGIWDGSVSEKAESEKAEGVCGVVSSRAKRLRKQRQGIFNRLGGKPITVLAMEWTAVIFLGKEKIPSLVKRVCWSRKGDRATTQRDQEKALLLTISGACRQSVIHVFDRGYGNGPCLGYLGAFQALFVIRWKKGPHFLDLGQEMALSRDSLAGPDRSGTKSSGTFKRDV
jgi:hypothetical protein